MQRLFIFAFLPRRLTSLRSWAKLLGHLCILLALHLVPPPAWPANPQQVRFLYSPGLDDLQGYDVKLLQHALNLTQQQYGPATIIRVPTTELPAREELELVTKHIDIAVLAPKPRRNEILFRIPTSLLQGMLGYRLLAVSTESSKKFTAMTSLQDLQQHLIGGVVLQWEDFRIYNHNKLLSSTSLEYQQVFDKLARGEIDYFSRGLHEVFRDLEYQRKSYPNLAIANEVALFYPFDFYFYTRSPDSKLTKRIMKGLAIAEKDGSMKQLFQQSFAKQIHKLKEINPKKVIYLHHPDTFPTDNFHYKWWLTHAPPATH